MKTRLVTISDIVLGYGSPQILHITETLAEIINTSALIFQPLLPQRQIIDVERPNLSVETLPTSVHPYSRVGRREYLDKCALKINKLQPDVLIVTNYILFDLFDALTYRPKKVVHLALEDIDHLIQGNFRSAELVRLKAQAILVDLWLFPEVNRAAHDAELLGIPYERIAIIYNLAEGESSFSQHRSGRMVYAGTLDAEISIGKHIFDAELASFPIDVFGDLQGTQRSKIEMAGKIAHLKELGARSKLKWHGQIPGQELDRLLSHYSFSLVMWLPVRHALMYAAPNKFFQAIAAGVPVISAPHPQPKMLIERYGCGILLGGWERHDLIAGLRAALRLIDSRSYGELLENCQHAVAAELSWSIQMNKVVKRFKIEEWK